MNSLAARQEKAPRQRLVGGGAGLLVVDHVLNHVHVRGGETPGKVRRDVPAPQVKQRPALRLRKEVEKVIDRTARADRVEPRSRGGLCRGVANAPGRQARPGKRHQPERLKMSRITPPKPSRSTGALSPSIEMAGGGNHRTPRGEPPCAQRRQKPFRGLP